MPAWSTGTTALILLQLGKAALDKAPLCGSCRSFKRGAIGDAGLVCASEPTEEVRARQLGIAVTGEFAARQHRVDEGKPGRRSVPHADRDCAVKLGHRPGIGDHKQVVPADDRGPVRRPPIDGRTMDGRDGRLKRVGRKGRPGQGGARRPTAFFDFSRVPEPPVLLVERREIAIGVHPRRAPRMLQQHKCEKPVDIRMWHMLAQQARQADGFLTEIRTLDRLTGRGSMTF